MSRGPEFGDLFGDELQPDEAARLRRVHDLLVEAGPPPELSPVLARTPDAPGRPRRDLFARRRRTLLSAAAALAAVSFGGGYLAGASWDGDRRPPRAFATEHVVRLAGSARPDATVIVRIGRRDDTGNVPMHVVAEGLRHLEEGDYYTLYMTRKGKRLVACGTFNVKGGNHKTNVRLTVGYTVDEFDGLALTEYRSEGHKDVPLLAGRLA